jgi:hypothetical protein
MQNQVAPPRTGVPLTANGEELDRLFVYGIFLDESKREQYGMYSPYYATVEGYATVGLGYGNIIVEAIPVREGNFVLTGMIVRVATRGTNIFGMQVNSWAMLDALEAGYKRELITTTEGEEAWMYVAR